MAVAASPAPPSRSSPAGNPAQRAVALAAAGFQAASSPSRGPSRALAELPAAAAAAIERTSVFELDTAVYAGTQTQPDKETVAAVLRVVVRHHRGEGLTEFQPGTASLARALLESAAGGEDAAVALLKLAAARLEAFAGEDTADAGLHREILVLADAMWRDMPELCRRLNDAGFDVVDLRDTVATWLSSVMAGHLVPEAARRAIDIFLLQGPADLMGLVYGIFKASADAIAACADSDLYRFVADLPHKMSAEQVDAAMRAGFEGFHQKAPRNAKLRERKSWPGSLDCPGALTFCKRVGDPDLHRAEARRLREAAAAELAARLPVTLGGTRAGSSRSLMGVDAGAAPPAAAAAAEAAPASGAAEGGGGGGIVHDDSVGVGIQDLVPADVDSVVPVRGAILQQLEHLRSTTPSKELGRLLGDAQRELRRQASEMERLLRDKHAAEERLLELESAADETLSSMDSEDAPSDSGPSPRRDVSSVSESSRVTRPAAHSRAVSRSLTVADVPDGCVRHSKLFQHQQFPCLYMEGYLLKAQGRAAAAAPAGAGGGKLGNVHRRFFVLQGSFLTYFKSHRNSKPTRDLSYDMRGRQVSRVEKHRFGKYCFEVSEQGDAKATLYLLFAGSEDERNVWIQVLQAAAES